MFVSVILLNRTFPDFLMKSALCENLKSQLQKKNETCRRFADQEYVTSRYAAGYPMLRECSLPEKTLVFTIFDQEWDSCSWGFSGQVFKLCQPTIPCKPLFIPTLLSCILSGLLSFHTSYLTFLIKVLLLGEIAIEKFGCLFCTFNVFIYGVKYILIPT